MLTSDVKLFHRMSQDTCSRYKSCVAYAYQGKTGWCEVYGLGLKQSETPPAWAYHYHIGERSGTDDISKGNDDAGAKCSVKGQGVCHAAPSCT